MESQLVSKLSTYAAAAAAAGPGALPDALMRHRRDASQQPAAGAGWPSAHHVLNGYNGSSGRSSSVPDPAGAGALAAYGRWAYEHGAAATSYPTQAPPQHQGPGQPGRPQAGAWSQGAGTGGGGYWPAAPAPAAGAAGYYAAAAAAAAAAPVSAPANGVDGAGGRGGGGVVGVGAGSDSTDSSDDGGGGAAQRKSMFRKRMHPEAHHEHTHASAVVMAARESSELEKRLKKNAREQKRANKINDQIAIMKSILEGVGLRPPATKSSILSEGIALVRHLLASADADKLAAIRDATRHGMLAPGAAGADEGGFGGGGLDSGGPGSLSPGLGSGPESLAALEPYVMLFRKSATPLAMAAPGGDYPFLDCNLRFAEVFKTAPDELQQATLLAYTREADAANTRRVLALVSEPGPVPGLDESTDPLEVVLTNAEGERFLVRVSALADDASGKPAYLLFTPKAVLCSVSSTPELDEAAAAAAALAAAAATATEAGGESGGSQEEPRTTPAVKAEAGAISASRNGQPAHHHHQQQQQQHCAVSSATSGEDSSLATSANSSSSSLYRGSPLGGGGGASLAGTTEAAMAAARTLPAHVRSVM